MNNVEVEMSRARIRYLELTDPIGRFVLTCINRPGGMKFLFRIRDRDAAIRDTTAECQQRIQEQHLHA